MCFFLELHLTYTLPQNFNSGSAPLPKCSFVFITNWNVGPDMIRPVWDFFHVFSEHGRRCSVNRPFVAPVLCETRCINKKFTHIIGNNRRRRRRNEDFLRREPYVSDVGAGRGRRERRRRRQVWDSCFTPPTPLARYLPAVVYAASGIKHTATAA